VKYPFKFRNLADEHKVGTSKNLASLVFRLPTLWIIRGVQVFACTILTLIKTVQANTLLPRCLCQKPLLCLAEVFSG
jgi:hypothetical protein